MRTRTRRTNEAGVARPPPWETLEFMRLIWAVDHGLQKTSKRMATSLRITSLQRRVIRMVGHTPGISAGQLAATLHVHPSTLTGVLKRLDQKGLLSRRFDPTDARRAVLVLTRTGNRRNVASAGTVEAAISRTLARLSPSKTRHVTEALRLLAGYLGVVMAAGPVTNPRSERGTGSRATGRPRDSR